MQFVAIGRTLVEGSNVRAHFCLPPKTYHDSAGFRGIVRVPLFLQKVAGHMDEGYHSPYNVDKRPW